MGIFFSLFSFVFFFPSISFIVTAISLVYYCFHRSFARREEAIIIIFFLFWIYRSSVGISFCQNNQMKAYLIPHLKMFHARTFLPLVRRVCMSTDNMKKNCTRASLRHCTRKNSVWNNETIVILHREKFASMTCTLHTCIMYMHM